MLADALIKVLVELVNEQDFHILSVHLLNAKFIQLPYLKFHAPMLCVFEGFKKKLKECAYSKVW